MSSCSEFLKDEMRVVDYLHTTATLASHISVRAHGYNVRTFDSGRQIHICHGRVEALDVSHTLQFLPATPLSSPRFQYRVIARPPSRVTPLPAALHPHSRFITHSAMEGAANDRYAYLCVVLGIALPWPRGAQCRGLIADRAHAAETANISIHTSATHVLFATNMILLYKTNGQWHITLTLLLCDITPPRGVNTGITSAGQ